MTAPFFSFQITVLKKIPGQSRQGKEAGKIYKCLIFLFDQNYLLHKVGWGQRFGKFRQETDEDEREVKLSLSEPFLTLIAEVVDMDISDRKTEKTFYAHMKNVMRNTLPRLRKKLEAENDD